MLTTSNLFILSSYSTIYGLKCLIQQLTQEQIHSLYTCLSAVTDISFQVEAFPVTHVLKGGCRKQYASFPGALCAFPLLCKYSY